MISFWKRLLLASAAATPIWLCMLPVGAQPTFIEEVKVQVNTELVEFPDAQPFLNEKEQLQVPAKAIAEKLGIELTSTYVQNAQHLTFKKEDTVLTLQVGSSNVFVNGKQLKQPYDTKVLDGRVYVPFRLIAEAFSIQTQWDEKNRIAILGADGQYHAPAWYSGPRFTKKLSVKATAYTADAVENGGWAGKDFLGNELQLGTIAADPSLLPLGTKVYIEGYSYTGLPEGGMYAEVLDVGGSIEGNRIDIFVPQSKQEAKSFGIQPVTIYILEP